MPTITLKNIPEDLYEQLKIQAALNHRSINSEVIVCIEKGVQKRVHATDSILLQARQVREKSKQYLIRDQELDTVYTIYQNL